MCNRYVYRRGIIVGIVGIVGMIIVGMIVKKWVLIRECKGMS